MLTKRVRAGRVLAGLAALGCFATAALHSTGYPSIARLATGLPGMMGAAMPAVWLGFSLDLTVIGAVIGLLAIRPGPGARLILGVAALCPLGAAGLQLRFIGFITPTAILLTLGFMTLTAAALGLGDRRETSKPAHQGR